MDAYEAVKAALSSNIQEILVTIKKSGQDPLLRFSSVPGVSYIIEYKDEMNDADWKPLVSNLLATGNETTYRDETFGINTKRFYRISSN